MYVPAVPLMRWANDFTFTCPLCSICFHFRYRNQTDVHTSYLFGQRDTVSLSLYHSVWVVGCCCFFYCCTFPSTHATSTNNHQKPEHWFHIYSQTTHNTMQMNTDEVEVYRYNNYILVFVMAHGTYLCHGWVMVCFHMWHTFEIDFVHVFRQCDSAIYACLTVMCCYSTI